MPIRFRDEEEEEVVPGMPGTKEKSILEKIKELIPEDIQDQLPDLESVKKSALENLSGMKQSFMSGLEKAENDYNQLTPEQRAEQALGMAMGTVGGIGKGTNILKTEIPAAQALRNKALEKIVQGSEKVGFGPRIAPEVSKMSAMSKGAESLSNPTVASLKQQMDIAYNTGDFNKAKQFQQMLNRYFK